MFGVIHYIGTMVYSVVAVVMLTRMLPNNVSIKFNVFMPEHVGSNATQFNFDNTTFDPNRIYKVLFHDYDVNSTFWYNETIAEYMKAGNVNVITTEYSDGMKKQYMQSLANARQIGKEIGHFISDINKHRNVSFNKFHFIGLGLGAHIAAIAAETIYQSTQLKKSPTKVGRITGLDPVHKGFIMLKSSQRLSEDDADFVDIIHTSRFGLFSPIGHMDFYPNGGFGQKACKIHLGGQTSAAAAIFANSINGNKDNFKSYFCPDYKTFSAKKCPQLMTATMGDHAVKKFHGKYFLDISDETVRGYMNGSIANGMVHC